MSDSVTKVMLAAYRQDAMPTMFLSGMFRVAPENFHNSEEVEIDIERSEEDIAIAVQTLAAGARYNQEDLYTNKGFKPPIFRERGLVSADSLLKRQPSSNPFQSVDFQSAAIDKGVKLSTKLQRKILRAMEFQASEVLTKGTVTLIDGSGNALYTIDYKPKATHFPTVANAWGGAGEDPVGDIRSLADTIRADGFADPDMLIFGQGSFENFLQNTDVLNFIRADSVNIGRITPEGVVGQGATFQGTIKIGHYRYEMWTYSGRYKHPQTGVSTPFVPDDKVIVKSSRGRMDATFGGIPLLGSPDPRVPRALTSRINAPDRMGDFQLNAWVEKDRTGLTVESMSRPLMIPTAIDTYGCLDTQP